MTEEEKEAIEILKNRTGFRIDYKCRNCGSGGSTIIPPDVLYGEETDIALNYIEKLQKENDKLQKELEDINNKWKTTIEDYKKELEETKKHLNSNCNIALMDFGIDLINHILEGEKDDKNK